MVHENRHCNTKKKHGFEFHTITLIQYGNKQLPYYVNPQNAT